MGFVISSIMLGSFGALQGTVLTNRTLVEHDARLPRIDWWYDPAICAITDALSGSEHAPCPKIVMALASDWIWCQSDSVVANRMSIPPFAPLLQQLRSNTRLPGESARALRLRQTHTDWQCGSACFGQRAKGNDILNIFKNPEQAKPNVTSAFPDHATYIYIPTISSLWKPRSQIPRMGRSIGRISGCTLIICR